MATTAGQSVASQTGTDQVTDRENLQKVYDVLHGGQYPGSDLQKSNLRASNIAQNKFAQNLQQTQTTALDAIRKANASAIASGANAGIGAANQLSSILGLQTESQANAVQLANQFMQDEAEQSQWLTSAQLSAVQRGGELTAAEAAQRSADAQYWEQMGIDSEALMQKIQNNESALSAADAAGVQGSVISYARQLVEMSQFADTLQKKQEFLALANQLLANPTEDVLAQARAIAEAGATQGQQSLVEQATQREKNATIEQFRNDKLFGEAAANEVLSKIDPTSLDLAGEEYDLSPDELRETLKLWAQEYQGMVDGPEEVMALLEGRLDAYRSDLAYKAEKDPATKAILKQEAEEKAAVQKAKEDSLADEKKPQDKDAAETKKKEQKRTYMKATKSTNELLALEKRDDGKVTLSTKGWSTGDDWNFLTSYPSFTGDQILRDRIDTDGDANISGKTATLPDGSTYVFNGNSANAEKAFADVVIKQYQDEINKRVSQEDYAGAQSLIESINKYLSKGTDSCITGDTFITMSDGTQKQVKFIVPGEGVLSYTPNGNVVTTLYTPLKHRAYKKTVLRLTFSNGKFVDTADGHSFCLSKPRKCVSISLKNVKKYIGKEFLIGPGQYAVLQKISTYETSEPLYSPMASKHMWLYTNGILSTAHLTEFIVNARLRKYNKAKLIKYSDVPESIRKDVSEELFNAYDGEMLAIWAKGFKKLTIKKKIKNLIKLLD